MTFKKTGHLLIITQWSCSLIVSFYAFRDPGVIQVNQTGELADTNTPGLDTDAY